MKKNKMKVFLSFFLLGCCCISCCCYCWLGGDPGSFSLNGDGDVSRYPMLMSVFHGRARLSTQKKNTSLLFHLVFFLTASLFLIKHCCWNSLPQAALDQGNIKMEVAWKMEQYGYLFQTRGCSTISPHLEWKMDKRVARLKVWSGLFKRPPPEGMSHKGKDWMSAKWHENLIKVERKKAKRRLAQDNGEIWWK